MRVDCINKCFGHKARKETGNCTSPFIKPSILWRNDSAYSSYHDTKLCQANYWFPPIDIVDEREQLWNNCEVKCRPDCVNRHYQKLMKNYEKLLYNYKVPLYATKLNFFHNTIPDQITEHMKEMTFVDFSGNFGGLVGVWLGFSIATMISDLLVIIRDKYLKDFIMPI